MDKELPVGWIPSYDELYRVTCEYVKKHQGQKGYIDTQDEWNDTIYALVLFDTEYTEMKVCGVKCMDDDLYVFCDVCPSSYSMEYSDKDFKEPETWLHLRWSDVHFRFTLYNIAEVIHEYVN